MGWCPPGLLKVFDSVGIHCTQWCGGDTEKSSTNTTTVTTTTNNTTNNYHLVSDTAAPALSPTHRKIDLDAFVVTDGPIVTYTIRDKLRVYKTKKAARAPTSTARLARA